jgi:hypothetical protein
MGDVHGDPVAQIKTLKGAGLVAGNGPYTWTGGKAILIATGDVIDKGSRSLPAIDNFIALEADAAAKGGRVVVTIGNHEAEFLADPENKKSRAFHDELKAAKLDPGEVAAGKTIYGAFLRARPLAVLAGDWFFSHAGNSKKRSVKRLESQFMKRFDAGDFEEIAMDALLEARKDWWDDRSELEESLAALHAKHLVYGHQPGKVPCPPERDRPAATLWTCYNGLVFLEDVAMSSAVDTTSRGGLLHIEAGAQPKVTAVYPDGSKKPIWSEKK